MRVLPLPMRFTRGTTRRSFSCALTTRIQAVQREYETAIRTDLIWLESLGINGPTDGPLDRYQAAIEALKASGRLYPCFETEQNDGRQA